MGLRDYNNATERIIAMAKIKCLYMDDRFEDGEYFSGILKDSLGADNITIDCTATPNEALKKLGETGNQHYDLFIADVLFPKPNNRRQFSPDGLGAVKTARGRHPNLVIVGLSVAERDYAGTASQFIEKGGDGFIDKDEIRQGNKGCEHVREIILHAFDRHKQQTPMAALGQDGFLLKLEPSDSLVLQAQVETVGRSVIYALAKRFATECESFVVNYVSPGLSGAFVFHLSGYLPSANVPERDVLLKLSREGEVLRNEVKRCPKTGASPLGAYVRYEERVESFNEWHALVAEFCREGCTLLDWLTSPDYIVDGQEIERTLEQLLGFLKADYEKGTPAKEESALDLMLMSLPRRARALLAVQQLWPVIDKHLDPKPNVDVLRSFLRQDVVGKQVIKTLRATAKSFCHGDLHTRNIMIDKQTQRPLLIDPAERGSRHFAYDWARLCADLFISAWDRGPESYEWHNLQSWRQLLDDWLAGKEPSLACAGANERVWTALAWLREVENWNSESVSPGGGELWERHLALAVQFTTMSGWVHVPAAKRALALVFAHDILANLPNELPKPAEV